MAKCVMKYLMLFSLFIASASCSKKEDIITSIEDNTKVKIKTNTEKIYILNENFIVCDKCFNLFIDYVQMKDLGENELLVVNNTKTLINIDLFKNKKNTFVIHDYNLKLEPHLGVIYLDNLKVDSILNVTPENVWDFIASDSQ